MSEMLVRSSSAWIESVVAARDFSMSGSADALIEFLAFNGELIST